MENMGHHRYMGPKNPSKQIFMFTQTKNYSGEFELIHENSKKEKQILNKQIYMKTRPVCDNFINK
jgi:hypothetical protein